MSDHVRDDVGNHDVRHARPQPAANRPGACAITSAKPLMRTFSAATRTATGSRSVASTSFAPASAAAMARMPVPVPMSMTVSPGLDVVLDQLHAHAGGLVRAGAKGHARVDFDDLIVRLRVDTFPSRA